MSITSTSFKGGLQTDLVFGADVSTTQELDNFYINSDGSLAKRLGLRLVDASHTSNNWLSTFDVPNNPATELTKIQTYHTFWDSYRGRKLLEYGWAIRVVGSETVKYLYTIHYSVNPDGTVENDGVIAALGMNIDFDELGVYQELDITLNSRFVVFGNQLPTSRNMLILTMDTNTQATELVDGTVQVRDYWGTDNEFDGRPILAEVTTSQLYHYYNAGWTLDQLTAFETALATFPSINDVPYYGKNAKAVKRADAGGFLNTATSLLGGASTSILTDAAGAVYDYAKNMAETLPAVHSFETKAPIGHQLINPLARTTTRNNNGTWSVYVSDFNARYATAIGAGTANDSTIYGYNAAVEFHGGRLFTVLPVSEVAGATELDTAPNVKDTIYYSQPTTALADLTKMYSTQDPTNEDFTPTASDGGWLTSTYTGRVVSLRSLANTLYVFTDKEIVTLTTQSQVFDPTNYSVRTVSQVGILSPLHVISVGEGFVFIGEDRRVYALEGGQVTNLVDNRIRGDFTIDKITSDEFYSIRLSFDANDAKVSVHVPSSEATLPNTSFKRYDTEWVFSLPLNAWSKNTFTTGDNIILSVADKNYDASPYADLRVDTLARPQETIRSNVATNYFAYIPIGVSDNWLGRCQQKVAVDSSTTFLDLDVGDYTATAETNELIQEPQGKRNNTTYLTSYFLRTEGLDMLAAQIHESACTVTGIYDYEYENTSTQDAYFYSNISINKTARNKNVVHSNLTLPGNADNIRIRYESEAGKDCVLLGYNLDINVNVRK